MMSLRRVRNEQLRLTAKNAAAVIDLFDGEPSACDLRFSKLRKDPGERLDHADFYRLRFASANWKRRHNRARGACQAGFENGATANSTCVRRRCFPRFWVQVIGSGPAGSKFSGPRLRRQGTRRYVPSSPGRRSEIKRGLRPSRRYAVWAGSRAGAVGQPAGQRRWRGARILKPRRRGPVRRCFRGTKPTRAKQGLSDVCP